MSGFYKPHRNPNWNYGGGRWKLSRSKIDLFLDCPRCFYVDNKLGTARPPGFPFALNSAVDHLLKKEFDQHRAAGTPHPLMVEGGLDAVPFAHEKMDTWRENFEGVIVRHQPTGFTVSGAVDDIWVKPNGELLIVDYKSTSKDETPTLDAPWQIGYKRQMEVYQWLLRQSGFTVSDTGYFVYANGLKDRPFFDAKLEFEIVLLPYTGSGDWIEETLHDIKACLEANTIPPAGPECDYCTYRDAYRDSTAGIEDAPATPPQAPPTTPPQQQESPQPPKKTPPRNATLF